MQKDPFIQYSVTAFYHFTDRRNLKLIRDAGGLYSLAKLREMKMEVPAPGGNEWSHDADQRKGLDQYVHLCFKNNHPMEFVARQEGRITDSVFLRIHPAVVQRQGVKFTADVSNKRGVDVYSIEEAQKIIDFDVLYTRTDWTVPEIQQRLRQAEKYEILVPDHIPLELIRNLPDG
ncbi:MAG TPA: DarT ssDNA thymidine ADP-ribosyltransferase family protein [Candidatus Angelobacter sp.]|jgi:hypothetical protein